MLTASPTCFASPNPIQHLILLTHIFLHQLINSCIQQSMLNYHPFTSMAREGVYVYDMVAGAPRAPAWGSLVRSNTYREKNKVVEQPRRSERRSVSGAEGAAAALLQVKVLASDMPGFMQRHAFRCARTTFDALDKFSSKHVAFTIKKEFDKVYGPAWHCIVGSSFGTFVTHSTGCFLYFSMEKIYILVFKTKVERALLDQV